jgi:hypothetical protein
MKARLRGDVRVYSQLLCFLSNEIVATEYTTMREGIPYLVRVYLL